MEHEAAQEKPIIQFNQITKKFGSTNAVQELTLSIERGAFFVLVGASGSGKTTTLKMINRLILPTTGSLVFNGENIANLPLNTYRHRIGYVLQNSALFPNMTVLENAAVTMNAQGIKTKLARPKIEQLLREVGLNPDKYAQRMPHELSGGEQQRVGIVRALAAEPEVILMDEPFSALDPISRKQLQELVLDLHKNRQTTIVFVTHDMDEAIRLGTRIGVMQDGRLIQVGSPKNIMQHPKNAQVAELFKTQQTKTVADMVALGFYHVNAQQSGPFVSEEAALSELAKALLNAPTQIVQINQQISISQTDYLRYMAQL